ncbi:MAG: hypothetical protein ING44_14260 [Telmatospirillum sp.]|nr:hypothetical protein [Telmatospirillum sp.]
MKDRFLRFGKDIALGLAVASFVMLLMAGAAEIVLRFLPVRSDMLPEPVDAAQPIFRFAPDRDYVYSLGGDFSNANRGRVNKAGFVNDLEYAENDPRRLLAVVGDSFVEALMVPYAETIQGRLQARYPDGRVYSFGASGAPLSQYLIWAEFAARKYKADGLVVVVVGNDFAESLTSFGIKPGMAQYRADANGTLALDRADYAPKLAKRAWAARSALIRYLLLNLQVMDRLTALRRLGEPQEFAGFTPVRLPESVVRDSLAAIDAFLADLPVRTGLAPDRIMFVVDGFRDPQAARAQADTYFAMMRSSFMARAVAAGYSAIDMDVPFFEAYAQRPQRFDLDSDGHWSGAGHEIAAKSLIEKGFPARVLASPQAR